MTAATALVDEITNGVLDKIRHENIEYSIHTNQSPRLNKSQLGKELGKNGAWIDNNVFNPRFSVEIQSLIDQGLIQIKQTGKIPQYAFNRKAIYQFIQNHFSEMNWLDSVKGFRG